MNFKLWRVSTVCTIALGVAGLLMSTLSAVGCVPDEKKVDPGTLEVTWGFGSQSCEDVDLARVKAMLTPERDSGRSYESEADCDSWEIKMENLDPGIYSLEVLGLDEEGATRYRAEKDQVTIVEGEVAVAFMRNLTVMGADLTVEWRFDNGRFCVANGVDVVTIGIYEHGSRWTVYDGDHSCEEAVVELPNLRPGEVDVVAMGLDELGEALFMAESTIELVAAEDASIELVLEACDEDNPCM